MGTVFELAEMARTDYGCGGLGWLDSLDWLDWLGGVGSTGGGPSVVMCTLSWISGTLPSLTCTCVGLPRMRMRWTALPRAGTRSRRVTNLSTLRTVTGTCAEA